MSYVNVNNNNILLTLVQQYIHERGCDIFYVLTLSFFFFVFLCVQVEANNSYDIKVKSFEPRADGVIEEYNWSGGSSSLSGSSNSNGIRRQYQYEQQNQQMSSSSSGGTNNNNNMQLGRKGGGGGIGNGIVGGGGSSFENTYTSVTGIDFRLDGQPFLQREQLLTIRCVATLVDKAWEAQTNITIQSYQPPRLSSTGQNRYASGKIIYENGIFFVFVSFTHWMTFRESLSSYPAT